jgi:hypothetical protein
MTGLSPAIFRRRSLRWPPTSRALLYGADGEAVANALSHHHKIRLDVEGLDAPEVVPCAPEACLDLVGDQEHAPLVQNLLDPLEVAWRRLDKAPHPLYRLGDERGHVACGLLLYDRAHVVGTAQVAPALVFAEPAA